MRYTRKNGVIRRHIQEHRTLYIIIMFLFTVGFIVGAINSAFLSMDIKQESTNYILTFVEAIKTKNININLLFKEVMISNIKPILYIWIFGLVIIGIPAVFIYIGVYGYSLGFTITSVLSTLGVGKGSVFLIVSLLPQEIIFVPLVFFIALNAILFSKTISTTIKSNMKSEIAAYTVIFIMISIITVGVSIFQTYIGANLVKGIMNII